MTLSARAYTCPPFYDDEGRRLEVAKRMSQHPRKRRGPIKDLQREHQRPPVYEFAGDTANPDANRGTLPSDIRRIVQIDHNRSPLFTGAGLHRRRANKGCNSNGRTSKLPSETVPM